MKTVYCELPALVVVLLAGPALMAQGLLSPIATQTVIENPGSYFLNRDITYNPELGPGIQILASGVTLNLSGYEVRGIGGLRGTAIQVLNAQGVTVRNGSLADGQFGVVVEGSASVRVTGLNIRGQGQRATRLPPEVGVMVVQSRNVVVDDNLVFNTGYGIYVRGGRSWGNRIARNTLTAGTNGLTGVFYDLAVGDREGPVGDLIADNLITNFAMGLQFSATSRSNVASGNTIIYSNEPYENLNRSNVLNENTTVRIE